MPPATPFPLAIVTPERVIEPELIVRTVTALLPEMMRLSAPGPRMLTCAVEVSVPSVLLSVMVLGVLNWKAMSPAPFELACAIASRREHVLPQEPSLESLVVFTRR